MSGRMTYRPHTHTEPPLFASVFNPVGSVWTCDCGKAWTLTRADGGGRIWREGHAPFPPKYTDDLSGALAFIRDEANRHRRALGLVTR